MSAGRGPEQTNLALRLLALQTLAQRTGESFRFARVPSLVEDTATAAQVASERVQANLAELKLQQELAGK